MMKYNILCVDDNKNNLFTLKSLLENIEHVNVVLAESGFIALEILLKESIDLILLDVQMPEMDGFMVATFIKKNKKTAHIPIIFISAVFISEEFVKRGYRTGAIDYLAKPIDDNLLLNKIYFYIKLFEKEKELEKEKERFQNILDLQDNIVIVVDKTDMLYVNKAFLDFFGFNSLNGFLKKYRCICDKFIAEDDFLVGSDNKSWIDAVLNNREVQHIACMIHEDKKRYFAVTVNILNVELEQFVCTFTDITEIKTESLNFEKEAVLDPLTHVFNRRMFEKESKKMLYLANKYRFDLSLMIVDIDHFKRVNDTFGHQMGDTVLVEIANRISTHIRKGDLFARYGGEEFVILILQHSDDVLKKAYDINKIIANTPFEGVGEVTISIGFAKRKEGESIESMFARADSALYEAKKNGRNRVEIGE
ncbi:MAG: diguanylate cyclase [Campylobacterales bacterium]|nr:diguanylate cyclase [Campylobacterales bacterium]